MSEQMQREWRFYIDDMVGFCRKALAYTEGLKYDATLRNIELIGEAATHVPESVRLAHPEIAWRKVIATRNRLIHGYLGIDNDVLWSIVESDIPLLLEQLQIVQSTR